MFRALFASLTSLQAERSRGDEEDVDAERLLFENAFSEPEGWEMREMREK